MHFDDILAGDSVHFRKIITFFYVYLLLVLDFIWLFLFPVLRPRNTGEFAVDDPIIISEEEGSDHINRLCASWPQPALGCPSGYVVAFS
jgi:hypothetical protein